MSDLAKRIDAPEGGLAVNARNPFGPLLAEISRSGITSENVAVLERMGALFERQEARNAEQDYAEAFAALQADIPSIKPERLIPNRGLFAAFADLMEVVQPLLRKHGFSVRFDTDYAENPLRVVALCYLKHAGGHEGEPTKFSARVGKGVGGSDAQGDGAAFTFAKRYALTAALNIVVDVDADARALGRPITEEQAADLERRAAKVFDGDAGGLARFMRLCGADKFSGVTQGKLGVAIAELDRREARPAAIPAAEVPTGFDDADEWRDRMLLEMGQRWECGPSEAATALNDLLRRGKYGKAGDVPVDRRVKAWKSLVSGELDAHRPKAG